MYFLIGMALLHAPEINLATQNPQELVRSIFRTQFTTIDLPGHDTNVASAVLPGVSVKPATFLVD